MTTLGDLLPQTEQPRTIYSDAKEKVQKIRDLNGTGRYDENLAKYIPGLLELAFQGMLEDIDTKEKTAHPSYKDMEQLDFQTLLTENDYVKSQRYLYLFSYQN